MTEAGRRDTTTAYNRSAVRTGDVGDRAGAVGATQHGTVGVPDLNVVEHLKAGSVVNDAGVRGGAAATLIHQGLVLNPLDAVETTGLGPGVARLGIDHRGPRRDGIETAAAIPNQLRGRSARRPETSTLSPIRCDSNSSRNREPCLP